MKITKSEAEVIIKLAGKLINAIDEEINAIDTEINEKKVLRSMEDGPDLDELASKQSEEINLRGNVANCED